MSQANQEQIDDWNGEVGARWARSQAVIDAVFAPLTQALFQALALQPAERVLDIGCGAGETALIAARRLGPEGRVTAVDVSAPLLALARERAGREAPGLARIDWIEADAQGHAFGTEAFGQALSRFGLMFFADSTMAFANIRRSLRPGGRLTFLCWRSLAENAWVTVPREAVLPLVPDAVPPAPGEPGPFRFADRAGLLAILEAAGFCGIACEPLDRSVTLGRAEDPRAAAEAAAEFAVGLGPVARLVREREPAVREAARAAISEAFAPLARNGCVRLGAACWLVSAVRRTSGQAAGTPLANPFVAEG